MSDDLFSYLLQAYTNDPVNQLKEKASKLDKERLAAKIAQTEAFVEFAKRYLQTFPPVAFDYLVEGNAVTLSNGDRVRFVPAKKEEEFKMYEGEIAVTNKNRESNIQPSYSQKI